MKGLLKHAKRWYDFSGAKRGPMSPHAANSAAAKIVEEQVCEVHRVTPDHLAEAHLKPLEMSLRDREAYFEAVLNPPAPNDLMKQTVKRYFELAKR